VNFKLLVPTYRTRERWVHEALSGLGPKPLGRMLNLGSGEGDIDAALATYATELESCDVNEADVAHAKSLNAGIPNVRYSVEDGEALSFADDSFDVVTCLEVIEHVPRPTAMLAEIARVIRPGGALVLSCPSVHFPVTYDPVNAALASFGGRGGGGGARPPHLPFGAYGYGHSWLVDAGELEGWLRDAGLVIEREDKLSGWLVGATECYWPGLLQRVLKANAGNTTASAARAVPKLRPTARRPPLVAAVDGLIALDRALSSSSKEARSVGLGFVARKTRA